jgi:ribosomal protein L9
LPVAIKALGEYDVTAKLGAGVTTTFKVVVKAS